MGVVFGSLRSVVIIRGRLSRLHWKEQSQNYVNDQLDPAASMLHQVII